MAIPALCRGEGSGFRVWLPAPPKRPGPAYVSEAGLVTAWRAVMLGNRSGDLIASQLIGDLNPPTQGDFSWALPGKAAWNWWSGPWQACSRAWIITNALSISPPPDGRIT